jgi:hypothetical protein
MPSKAILRPSCICILIGIVLAALFVFAQIQPAEEFMATATEKLSAYYQCYNHIIAAEEVLKRFRSFYPFEEIRMLNDAGDQRLSLLAMKYHTHYTYANRTSIQDHGMYFTSWQKGAVYVKRIIEASEACDWLILLEDDVWVLSGIPLHKLHFDINGAYSRLLLPDCLVRAIRAMNPGIQQRLQYAGNGGSLLRCSFFRNLSTKNWTQALPSIFRARDDYIASDEMISSLTYVFGGSIGPYPSFSEPTFFTFLFSYMTGAISVLHEAKFLYD